MPLRHPFEKEKSPIFGFIYRPYLKVEFWSKNRQKWISSLMVVDTGADYTILPRHFDRELGVNLNKDAAVLETWGVGGKSKVYLLKEKQAVKIGPWKRMIPVGIINSYDVPPLIGRHEFLETFKVCFVNHYTEVDISSDGK